MSTLSVDMIEPVGSTLTLGQSGDTVTIPAGGTFVNSGTATGFGSGNLYASQWRMTTDFTSDKTPITLNWEAVDSPLGYGNKGAAMTQALGIFTFPATGIWLIDYNLMFSPSASATGVMSIYTTHNDATYAIASEAAQTGYYLSDSMSCSYIMNVSSTSTHKVRFHIVWSTAQVSQTTRGNADINETFVTFTRLSA
jgi:hypothetical protein